MKGNFWASFEETLENVFKNYNAEQGSFPSMFRMQTQNRNQGEQVKASSSQLNAVAQSRN